MVRSHFVANVCDKPHSVIWDDLARWCKSHHDIPAGIIICGEGALIEPVGDGRPGAEVVMVKVMRWNVCEDGPAADSQSSQAACRDAGLQERSSLHFCGDLHLDEADLEI